MLLTAAAIGESLAFIGGLVGASNLAWIGYAIVIGPVLFVLAKLLRTPKDITNTIESVDSASDADTLDSSDQEARDPRT